ncbi:hypothetical protein HOY82DRAFT_418854 [Tuber indicum]|nr:hypothetical protein HOY82DRAFT_418854 [Tuber indicum]
MILDSIIILCFPLLSQWAAGLRRGFIYSIFHLSHQERLLHSRTSPHLPVEDRYHWSHCYERNPAYLSPPTI